ncbi:hypothetical protein REDROCK_96 [Mycobacterium phage RedRock]|uniref:Uncharacterized protein n=1 Tax=Mycobacterium phage RedRock TaxID=711470 RepID=D3JZF8_9CAUD|nr:hypothetical protein REDROCK_96 [Mycobacterium phage RedRock]ADB93789.1 hypothetical protein REDROCK_96 [Mycobacterium phage RedRock]
MRYMGEPGNAARNVKASARDTSKTPFIAPDIAPVALLDRELEKGLKGWTDFDVKIEDNAMVDGGAVRAAEAEFEAMTVGTMIARKAPATTARVRRPRPTTRRWA